MAETRQLFPVEVAPALALVAREVAGLLRLAVTCDDEAALSDSVQRRISEILSALPMAGRAAFMTLLNELPTALRGAGSRSPALSQIMDLIAASDAGEMLAAGPRAYTTGGPHGLPVCTTPRAILALAIMRAVSAWKPETGQASLTGVQAKQMLSVASSGLAEQQAPGLLKMAQQAWRDGTYDEDWDSAVRRLEAHSHRGFPWPPHDVSLMIALLSPNRIAGSPWLGPLAPQLTAVARENPAWAALFTEVLASDGGAKPAKTFAAKAARSVAPIGAEAFCRQLMEWLDLHPLDPNLPDPDGDALKQLIWLTVACGEAACDPLGRFAQRCFVKVPQVGARSVKLGNAALAVLGLIDPPEAGAAQLDRLRQRVKYPSALKQIEAALAMAAKRAGLTVEDLAELAVPDFDLGPEASVRIDTPLGGATLRLSGGRRVSLCWHDAAGREQASPPAALKKADPALVKDFTERRRALEAMLAGQITRLERLFETKRAWAAPVWTARYVRHGLLGPLSQRLIWHVGRPNGTTASLLPTGTACIDAAGNQVELQPGDQIRLWHPIDASVDEVLAWRDTIVERAIIQPFKQAHREIYRLTEAERATATYSNRFAGHILRQHQMLELAKARGWTGSLHGGFDNPQDLGKSFPDHRLRVSYDVAPILGHDNDLGPTGIALRVATDRIIFSLAPAGPAVPLAEIPPILLSEALRDVDLMVAVASLGADPTWQDGGPQGRFGDYWCRFAQADLEESGKMRHAILASLLPRLNIAPHCTLEPRHLVVEGRRRRYRIHLGSGSTFFEPEGQYLCIVQDRRGERDDIALPFEGDTMLATILSKATLLVRDDLIKDTSILKQLGYAPEN